MGVKFKGNILIQPNGGPLPITLGGTGQITASGAINALLPSQTGNSGEYLSTDGTSVFWAPISGAGLGSVTTVSIVSANGFAGTVATATSTPDITLTTTVAGLIKGNGTAISAATSGVDYSSGTSLLSTGILKSATSTGELSIAVPADFPTLNQNTTGRAALADEADYAISAGTASTSLNLNGLSSNGIVIKNGTNTFTVRNLAVVNIGPALALSTTASADGVSGNPTVVFTSTALATENTVVSRDATGSTAVADSSTVGGVLMGYRSIPKVTSTTLSTPSVGKCHSVSSNVTFPSNIFTAGDAITIYNNSSSAIILTQGAGLTLRLSGTTTTGSRTLASYGMATIWYNTTTEAVASGTGLT